MIVSLRRPASNTETPVATRILLPSLWFSRVGSLPISRGAARLMKPWPRSPGSSKVIWAPACFGPASRASPMLRTVVRSSSTGRSDSSASSSAGATTSSQASSDGARIT